MDSIHLSPPDETTLAADQAEVLSNAQLSVVKASICGADDVYQVSEGEDDPKKICAGTEEKGTLIMSLISMTVTMVGLGILGLPLAFAEAGIIGGIVLVVVCAIATDLGLVALVRIQKKSGALSYEDQAEFYFGKIGRGIVYFLVNLDLLMAGAQQLTPFAQFTGNTIQRWSGCAIESKASVQTATTTTTLSNAATSECPGWNQYTITLIPLVLVFPFFLMKSIHALKYASSISVVCLCVSMLIFFIYYASWSHIADPNVAKESDYYAIIIPLHTTVQLWPTSAENFLDAIGIIFFAYICHFQIMLLYGEMETKKNIYPVIHASTLGFAMPLYILIGLFGYFLFGDTLLTTNGGVAMFFDLFDTNFVAGQVAIFAIGVTSAYKMALFVNPLRNAMRVGLNALALKFGKSENFLPSSLWYRVPCAIVLSIFAYVGALFVPLDKMLIYAGSITGASLGGYVIGGLLIRYVLMYGVQQLPELCTDAASFKLTKCGILSPSTFLALSSDMKRSYVLAWALIVYGVAGTILGLVPSILQAASASAER